MYVCLYWQPFVVAVGYLFGFHFLTIFFTYTVYTLSAFLMFNGARFWFRPMVEAWLRDHRVVEGMAQVHFSSICSFGFVLHSALHCPPCIQHHAQMQMHLLAHAVRKANAVLDGADEAT